MSDSGLNPAIKAVLFDVDGTLVDSTYAHTLAWWHAFRAADVDVPMWRIHRAIGMGADQLVPHVTDNQPGLDIETLGQAQDAIFSTFWPSLRALPGARELVERCHDAGLITVLASSAGADELKVLRRVLDADNALDYTTDSSDSGSSKPEPDLVAIALKRAGVREAEAVFVGDAVWDVQACAKAGVRCIGFQCGGTSEDELRAAGAIEVYLDAADLLTRWAHSPLAPTTN